MVKFSRMYVSMSDWWVSSHDKLSDFYASSWQRGESAVPLLVLRLLLLGVALGILGWSVSSQPTAYWLIFLTNWGLVLVCAMLLSGVYVSCKAVVNLKGLEEENGKKMLPWCVSVQWLLSNIGVTVSILICCLYWILLYNPETYKASMNGPSLALDVLTHGVNPALAFVEVMAARTPVRLAHVLQPLAVGLWYAAFTAIYYAAGGTSGNGIPYIYELLDWREGRRSLIVVTLSALGLILVFLVLYGLAFFRDKFTSWAFRTTSVQLTHMPPDIPRMENNFV